MIKNKERNEEESKTQKIKNFPIIGIGSSAGGLEALKHFFSKMPSNSGMAFVIVQHMDPNRVSNLPHFFESFTKMKVNQIEDGMPVRPNEVYIIPPNMDLGLLNGIFQLIKPLEAHRLRHPIDVFLNNLAEDQNYFATAIILSGYGNDGSNGIKSIKTSGGLVIAQKPLSAGADGMPSNAVGTGLVDYVLEPDEMPDKLLKYYDSSKKLVGAEFSKDKNFSNNLQKIFILIRNKIGHDFSQYKESTVYRRIIRRMNLHNIDNISDYITYIQRNSGEIDLLFQELLINVTSFFRDEEVFELIKNDVLDGLLKKKSENSPLRIWVPGCSTGEEVYSLAILIREFLEKKGWNRQVQIFGTDIDEKAVKMARKGHYSFNIGNDVSKERIRRFFIKKEDYYQIKNEIREMAIFARHDVLSDPPFAQLDILSCRNLLIYLKSDAQKKLLSKFDYALKNDGILILGQSETVGNFLDAYSIINKRFKVFRHIKLYNHIQRPEMDNRSFVFGLSEIPEEPFKMLNRKDISELATENFLENYVPPSLIVDEIGKILYIHGPVNRFLEFSQGKARMNVYEMAKENIRFQIRSAIQNADSNNKNIVIKSLTLKENDKTFHFDLSVKKIKETDEKNGSEYENSQGLFMISFIETKNPDYSDDSEIKIDGLSQSDNRIAELEDELKMTRDKLNKNVEDMRISYEELKAANEELQSMNEESQSTNEELETSKEELQSINEEMATINSELQMKIDELSRTNDDMRNLFNSTQIATIFLDKDLNLRRFTKEATKLINMIDSDIGRPISHIVSNIKHESLIEDILNVMETLIFFEKSVETKDEKWYLMRIIPYKTEHDVIDGVVITFNDITQQKVVQKKIQDALEYSENIINTLRESILVLDEDMMIISANDAFYDLFDVNSSQTEGKQFYEWNNNFFESPEIKDLMKNILENGEYYADFEIHPSSKHPNIKKLCLNAKKIYRGDINMNLILLAMGKCP